MSTATRSLRKSALSIAMGLCLASLVAAPAFAQSATGAVAGRGNSGDQVTVVNTATGASRSVTVTADGSYRLSQLPVGDYTLQVSRGGQSIGQSYQINVPLGGTATVNLGSEGGLANLATLTVVGNRVINRVDVYSTESATNINREELSRLPVDQGLGSVALLAPGVVATGATFGGLTFSGSTVAENQVYINGLNVTDPFRRQGFSTAPFAFYEEFQVKTGGYSAEFGRSTGGVINAVTRSGSNEFKAGAQFTFEPSAWQSSGKDRYHEADGSVHAVFSRDSSSWYKGNLWASGPIVKDKLFFFGMYERRESKAWGYGLSTATTSDNPNDFWGAKLDWRIADNHLIELLGFSDKTEGQTDRYQYNWDTDTRGNWIGSGFSASGGDNYSLTYTGHFTDTFVAKAMYGVNERNTIVGSPLDDACSVFVRTGEYNGVNGVPSLPVGCHPTGNSKTSRVDTRDAARLDFEWTLGDHQLRFGVDQEVLESVTSNVYPGDGQRYSAVVVVPGGPLSNGSVVPPGVTGILDARRYIQGAEVQSTSRGLYIEDNWNVTPNLLLSLGLRFDSFESKVGGDLFTESDFGDMMAPRLGFSWDMKGDGTTKLFGNAGRYYIPMTNRIPEYFGGGAIDEHTFYVINGWQQLAHPVTGNPYLAPIIGAQIGPVDDTFNVGGGGDFRTIVARDLKQVYQDEYILGFQQALNQEWSWGVNATYRTVERAIEDAYINSAPAACPWYSGDFPIINPGEKNTLWCPTTEEWFEIDTSVEGYRMRGSGNVVGYPKPKRTYKAVEFQLDRAWDDKWAFNASYLWSKTEGNIEGPVNSDLGYADTGMVQYFDHPAGVERFGVLFNDYRHQIKLRGSYKLNEVWSFGSTLSMRSGGPITAFGVVWPNDDRGGGSFTNEFGSGGTGWLCVANCSDWRTRELVYSERGAFGRLPWVYNLGANVTWTLPVPEVDLKVRFSVYNLLNQQTAVNVHSRYESQPGVKRPYFGEGTNWQSPRYMQLVVTYNY